MNKKVEIVAPGPQLRRRHRHDLLFRHAGLMATLLCLSFVVFLLGAIIGNGWSALRQTCIEVEVDFNESAFSSASLANGDFQAVVKAGLRRMFPEVTSRRDLRDLQGLVSTGAAYELRKMVEREPRLIGAKQKIWLLADDNADMLMKGKIDRNLAETNRRIKNNQLAWLDRLASEGKIKLRFNAAFFTAGDSREPELAGIWGAVTGSAVTLLLTFAFSFPVGLAAAVYLEEFAPRTRWAALIEGSINNLAAVPSIIFGLLGLAIFINCLGLPRATPLTGSLVLSLMTLPAIIIASRASLQAVPLPVREAALGIGASRMQAVLHHVIPLALPGMVSGAIAAMARAFGETAPLLLIGMVAFVTGASASVTGPATVLPVQIYLWADNTEPAFTEKTAAAIMILLVFLMIINSFTFYLRKKFENK